MRGTRRMAVTKMHCEVGARMHCEVGARMHCEVGARMHTTKMHSEVSAGFICDQRCGIQKDNLTRKKKI